MSRGFVPAVLPAVVVLVGLTGCTSSGGRSVDTPPPTSPPTSSPPTGSAPAPAGPAPTSTTEPDPPPFVVSDGTPRRARLTIAALDVDVPVVPYRGRTDDAAGTALQDRGLTTSPFGPQGGTGPGGIGNYQVTGHRTSSSRVFEFLPDLRRGDRVVVRAGGTAYVYEIRRTRITSFREPDSLREQRAPVPGRPGVTPTAAWITLSTCRTPEDHAEGNFWSDEFHNPEHRIDKIGVLVRTRPA